MRQAPANRYAYYLTPKGFAEKSRLTAQYLAISFNFFRASRRQCSEVFSLCARHGWRRVILAGASDLAEIATLCADDHGIELVGIFSPGEEHKMFAGLPVLDRLDNGEPFDAVVITDFQQPQLMLEAVRAYVPEERVHAPELLKISRSTATSSRS